MRTAIFTGKDNTQLTIGTEEVARLVQMGQEDTPIELAHGVNVVVVAAGVFKVESERAVRVTADHHDVEIAVTPFDKGDWPDPPMRLTPRADRKAVVQFFADARSID